MALRRYIHKRWADDKGRIEHRQRYWWRQINRRRRKAHHHRRESPGRGVWCNGDASCIDNRMAACIATVSSDRTNELNIKLLVAITMEIRDKQIAWHYVAGLTAAARRMHTWCIWRCELRSLYLAAANGWLEGFSCVVVCCWWSTVLSIVASAVTRFVDNCGDQRTEACENGVAWIYLINACIRYQ